jgi:DNA-binding CsgD family transcriptional regulator
MSKTISNILHKYHYHIKPLNQKQSNCSELINYPILPNQAIYVVDFVNKKVCFQKGIKELLGYEEHEFNFDFLSMMVHPANEVRYSQVLSFSLEFARKHAIKPFELEFSLSYHIKKKDGSYLSVLRNSTVFEVDESGQMLSNFSIVSDVSYLKKSKAVEWSMSTKDENIKEQFKRHMQEKHKGFFSKRELDILIKLRDGMMSKEIAEELHISKHTVDTHRRNMLSKSTCSNSMELVEFARENEIL